MTTHYATCRLCDRGIEREFDETGLCVLFKYGTRHYAHARCGLTKWGAAFLNMIPVHLVGDLPAIALDEHGLLDLARRKLHGVR